MPQQSLRDIPEGILAWGDDAIPYGEEEFHTLDEDSICCPDAMIGTFREG